MTFNSFIAKNTASTSLAHHEYVVVNQPRTLVGRAARNGTVPNAYGLEGRATHHDSARAIPSRNELCIEDGCSTRLSRYNRGSVCAGCSTRDADRAHR